MKKKPIKKISAKKFEKLFEEGADLRPYVDFDNPMTGDEFERKYLAPKRVNVDFPISLLQKLDRQAEKLGLARQALIKIFVAEKLGHDFTAN